MFVFIFVINIININYYSCNLFFSLQSQLKCIIRDNKLKENCFTAIVLF